MVKEQFHFFFEFLSSPLLIKIQIGSVIQNMLLIYLFYSSYRTFVIGYGSAPPERVSIIVIIIACIGMGIPLILLIAGGVYLAIKRMRNC